MTPRNLPALGACAALLGACTAEAPAAPSFQQHVMPILAAYCVRCHGDPPIGGAPAGLRLDSYAEVAIDDARTATGAAASAARIAARAADPERPMPPRFGLEDFQIETLARWAELGAPRGEPRPGNRAPAVVLESASPLGGAGGPGVALELLVRDPDGDLVAGELRARVGGAERVIGALRAGRVALAWAPAGVPPGSYPVTAHVDDGAGPVAIELGALALEAP